MLTLLNIKNIALIDSLSIAFDKGLNLLTGETGAGKSIIIDSLNAILGERFPKELIRTGADRAFIEAVFCVEKDISAVLLEPFGIESEEDGVIVLSREIFTSGRNNCRINGRQATVSMLSELGKGLVDIHGQYDNQSLLRTDSHIRLLDLFAGETTQKMISSYTELLSAYTRVCNERRTLSGETGERERKLDLLKYQIEEIESAALKTGEDDILEQKQKLYANSEKIIRGLSQAYEHLNASGGKGGALDLLGKAVSELSSIARYKDAFADCAGEIQDIVYRLQDISHDIHNQLESLEFDPSEAEKSGNRLDLISRLKRKYGAAIEEILFYLDKSKKEKAKLEGSEEMLAELDKKAVILEEKLFDMAYKLHEERKKCAKLLESNICKELDQLEMKHTSFFVNIVFDKEASLKETPLKETSLEEVSFKETSLKEASLKETSLKETSLKQTSLKETPLKEALFKETYNDNSDKKYFNKNKREFGARGLDRVEFMISTNPGEPLKPLTKIASGGEMSRIMLAIKTILAKVDFIPVLVFDEIDMGISGKAAIKVGEKLSVLSLYHQVLCVTHHASIAAMADQHFAIIKKTENNRTLTTVEKLDRRNSTEEIARLISGDITQLTRKSADEMLSNAKKFKEKSESSLR